jgi:hypothetical protein
MNLRKFRIALLLYCAFDFFIGGKCGGFLDLDIAAAAQFTTVSGTVTDPNGIPYANGTITAALVSSGSPTFTSGGGAYTPPTQPVGLSAAGSFVMQLADNTQLSPGGSTWTFTVSCGAGCVPPGFGKGQITFTVTGVTISGATQSITATLTAAAPALTSVVGGGGSGTVNSGTATQIAFYSASTNAVVSNPRLTDNGTQLSYTGATGINAGAGGVTTSGAVTGASANFTGAVTSPTFTGNAATATTSSGLTFGGTTLGTTSTAPTTGQFVQFNGTGLIGATPAVGTTTYASAFANLSSAISGVGSSSLVINDVPQTLAASSLNINVSNLTLGCASPNVPITFPSISSRLQIGNGGTAKNFTLQGCNLQGPDLATATGAPITVGPNGDASNFRMIGNSINGFGSTGGNGVVEILNASHVEVAGNRSGDIAVGSPCTVSTASWAAPVSGSMFGLETITFTAAGACAGTLASDMAVGNALLCSGMSPIVFNHPGDGQSTAFGQITAINGAAHQVTVQQLVNPGTYVSGGTCQAGVGNGEPEFAFNVVSNNNQLGDWNIHDNDVGSITVHQATVGAIVNGVRFSGNTLHPNFNGGYVWGLELGSFSGVTGAMAQAMQNVAESNNVCKIAADAAAGCYSQGNSQNLTETGNEGYSGGHTYTIQLDENAGANNLASTGGVWNGLGGGSIEDINRMNRGTITGPVMLYPSPTGQFIAGGAASGGVGAQAPAASSYNTLTGITMVTRVEICPPANSAWTNNTCGGQITSCVGAAGTVTCSFTPGTFMPWLANGQTFVIAGNQVTAPCGASTVNALQTVTGVSGGGTGFSFANASINGLTCIGGKATGDGLISTAGAGTTAYALFAAGPTPFKVGDTTLNIVSSTSSGGSFNATNQTVTGVGQGPPPFWVSWVSSAGSGLGGNGFAGNFNGKFISFQNNIAAGSVVDGNIFGDLNMVGNGGTASQGISLSNNASTSGSMDRNQATHVRMSDLGIAYNMAGTGSLAPTNTKIELGSFTNINAVANWNNGATISCDSANPSCLIGTGTGTCTSSVTLFLYNLGQTAATTCTGTTEGPSGFRSATSAGTAQGLFCTSTAVGVSGVVTVRDNSVNKAITCSLAGVTSCNDTAHSFAVAQGDLLDIQIATGAAETLANPKCTLFVWYRDN